MAQPTSAFPLLPLFLAETTLLQCQRHHAISPLYALVCEVPAIEQTFLFGGHYGPKVSPSTVHVEAVTLSTVECDCTWKWP